MTDERRPAAVAQAHPALLEMLDCLLAEVPEVQPEAPAPPTTPVAEPLPTAVETVPAAATETLNKPDVQPLQRPRECVIYGADTRTLDTPESNFSAIQFGVGKFRFVAPLNMLDSVVRIDTRPTPMFGQPDWHRGMVLNRGQQMVLVDLGLLLGLDGVEPVAEPDHVLVLPGGRYGILSSLPPEPLTLRGGAIRWSRPDPRRPWLAAVLPEQMCVMVDSEALLELLRA